MTYMGLFLSAINEIVALLGHLVRISWVVVHGGNATDFSESEERSRCLLMDDSVEKIRINRIQCTRSLREL